MNKAKMFLEELVLGVLLLAIYILVSLYRTIID